MIQLHSDYLLFETSQGQIIPCSAEVVAVELIGEASGSLNPELVEQASAAVLHYFKQDLGRTTVSVAEFSRALEQALQGLGLSVSSGQGPSDNAKRVRSFDLRQLVVGPQLAFELGLFPRLRDELRAHLGASPAVLRFHGLRGCVKQLVGAKRWSRRCQTLNDQIVGYLRACLETEAPAASCELVIQ